MVALVYLNGCWMPEGETLIRADDQGFLYGLGLFETMRVVAGRPVFVDRHLDRLWASAPVLGVDLPWDRKQVGAAVREIPGRNGAADGDGSVRLTVSAGPAHTPEPVLLITWRPGRPYPEDLYEQGITAVIAAGRRNPLSPLSRVKSLNYAESLLARRAAVASGAREALFLNSAEELAEGSATNLFLILGDRLLTPAVSCGILPGIARSVLLELVQGRLGLCVEEGHFPPALLEKANEVFLTNALMGVMPLVAVDGRPVGGGRPGPVTQALRKEWNIATSVVP